MALGFTGIPLPDLLADIRIANLLVCPGRAGWWVRRGWMETGVRFVQITLNPNAQLPVDVRSSISPSLSCWSEPLSSAAAGTAQHSLLPDYFECVISQNHFLPAFLPVLTQPLTSVEMSWMNKCSKIIAFKSNLGSAVMSRSDINIKPKQSLWQKSQ